METAVQWPEDLHASGQHLLAHLSHPVSSQDHPLNHASESLLSWSESSVMRTCLESEEELEYGKPLAPFRLHNPTRPSPNRLHALKRIPKVLTQKLMRLPEVPKPLIYLRKL